MTSSAFDCPPNPTKTLRMEVIAKSNAGMLTPGDSNNSNSFAITIRDRVEGTAVDSDALLGRLSQGARKLGSAPCACWDAKRDGWVCFRSGAQTLREVVEVLVVCGR